MSVDRITKGEFEQLRPCAGDDHYWFSLSAVAWYANPDRSRISVVYQPLDQSLSFVTFALNDDGVYRCCASGSGFTADSAAKTLGYMADDSGCVAGR